MGLRYPGNASCTFPATALPHGTNTRTFACWYRFLVAGNPANHQVLFSYGENTTGQRFSLFYANNVVGIGAEFCNFYAIHSWTPDTVWHHVAIVWPPGVTDANGILLYQDGASVTVNSLGAGAISTVTVSLSGMFGQLNAPGGLFPFNGDLAEAAVWSAALTANEIRALARGVPVRMMRPTRLVAYWPMMD